MKKIVNLVLILMLCLGLAACSGSDIDYSEYFQWMDTLGDETWTLYSVAILDDFDWNNANYTYRENMAELAIEKCKEKASADGISSSFGVSGFTSDGHIAFSWGTDHRSSIYMYENGIKDFDYFI